MGDCKRHGTPKANYIFRIFNTRGASMVTFSLSPSNYATKQPNEEVALDLSIGEVGYIGYIQGVNMNIDGTDYFMGLYQNLTGADPWHLPFSFPTPPWGGIPPQPPSDFPTGAHQIFFQSCDSNGVNDGVAVSNTATITLTDFSQPPPSPFPWWWIALALLGVGAGYVILKKT